MTENELSRHLVDAAIEVHSVLGGPGLLESVYEESLAWELESRGLHVDRQVSVPISYKGKSLSNPLRIDLVLDRKVIVEVKATSHYNVIYEAQVLTYLRLTEMILGLVINFGNRTLREGIHRVVNKL